LGKEGLGTKKGSDGRMTFIKKETKGKIQEEQGIKGKRRAGRRTVYPYPALSCPVLPSPALS
jgi:hypothetical protein